MLSLPPLLFRARAAGAGAGAARRPTGWRRCPGEGPGAQLGGAGAAAGAGAGQSGSESLVTRNDRHHSTRLLAVLYKHITLTASTARQPMRPRRRRAL